MSSRRCEAAGGYGSGDAEDVVSELCLEVL